MAKIIDLHPHIWNWRPSGKYWISYSKRYNPVFSCAAVQCFYTQPANYRRRNDPLIDPRSYSIDCVRFADFNELAGFRESSAL